MCYKDLNVIILAAGKGKRMLSNVPKVMHKIAGKFMLQHLIDSVSKINVRSIYVVYNFKKELINNIVNFNEQKIPIYWILQNIPKGTGHAVQQVLPMIGDDSEVLILYGDVPLISFVTLKKLMSIKKECDLCLLTFNLKNPQGYGRIIRDKFGDVVSIIEDSDVINNIYRKKNTEVNSGILISVSRYLKNWLSKVTYHKIKNELYLTDIIKVAYQNNYRIHTHIINPMNVFEVMGINNKSDLVYIERMYQKKQAKNLLELGIIVADPNRFDLRGTLICGEDVYIDINVIIEGHVSLGNRVYIGANCILKNVVIEDDVVIYPFSCLENSKIGFKSKVGPFARLRPETELHEKTNIGNFVELKNVQLGKNTKVGHLSYLGDAKIGSYVNIGAGTVICNYDGKRKNSTYIADNVFIGSDSQLIAPVVIGSCAVIGAGTTITKNVAEGDVVISRIHQFSILNKESLKTEE